MVAPSQFRVPAQNSLPNVFYANDSTCAISDTIFEGFIFRGYQKSRNGYAKLKSADLVVSFCAVFIQSSSKLLELHVGFNNILRHVMTDPGTPD